ncbi:hypothetical protein H310_04327 [Aphanomyces invadans]|uniref:Calpain catalytic domain-containing protein n=1 Tax=Aphanomyces invadans TaxID=157072 RepID=A0A024UDH4_9STRA|nr:hypothetical protein H310_04327 [Aphanomyces invadans]ETW03907.1 hypothetical protein H310_04327 [Aphanomyces invadans]|eukprot:XP_008866863.1 hypothetical protein H310_04327 [Aphanomyces invadans]
MQFEGAGITLERNVIAMLSECGDIPPMYEDPDFAAKPISLYLNPDKPPEYATSSKRPTANGGADEAASAIAWYRPGQVTADPDYFKCTAGCGVLREGTGLNDSWLLGVFAALALHPDNLIENLFVSPMHDFKTFGIYTCQFYKDCQWLEVVTDTRLPYSQPLEEVNEPKTGSAVMRPGHWLYGSSVNKSELFVPLLMKAYAKFHGNYEVLHNGSILEAFVDCTGGSVKKIDLADDASRKLIETGQLWHKVVKHVHYKSVVTCQLKMASMAYNEVTGTGILKNHLYVVQYVKELGPLKFVKLKNVWQKGLWKGDWSNDDSKWEDNLQVEAALRADPLCEFNRTKADGTFWMMWEDFVEAFNELYIVRNFPSTFQQYCVRGEWVGQAAAGPPMKPPPSVETSSASAPSAPSARKWLVEPDSEPSWFLNPQYRLVVTEKTSVVLSLLQRDFRVFGGDNFGINFVLLEVKKRALASSMVWEFDKTAVVAEGHSYPSGAAATAALGDKSAGHPEREISKGNVVLEPDVAYIFIPYTDHGGVEMEFFFRVFSPKPVQIDSLTPLNTLIVQGRWRVDDEGHSNAGGPLVQNLTTGMENLTWCQNPQYVLRSFAASKPVDIKLVLKRTGIKATAKGHRRDHQKDKGQLIGLAIVKPDVDESAAQATCKKKHPEKTNFLGEPLLSPTKPRRAQSVVQTKTAENATLPPRKLLVKADEYCVLSDYSSAHVASIFLRKVPPEWLAKGLLVVPSLGDARGEGAYDVEVHSDDVITMDEIPNEMVQTIAGEWNDKVNTAGGSHLCPDWKKNPKFYLTLKCVRPVSVTINLYRSEYEWRGKCKKDSVGAMMGFYLFQGTKGTRDTSTVVVDGKTWTETDFVPLHHVSSPKDLTLPPVFNESYVIMPTTWEPNKCGRFLLSVESDCEFTLQGESDS